MSRLLLPGGPLALILAITLAASAPAQAPPAPLRLLPEKTDIVIEVASPRRVVETGLKLETFKALQDFPAVKEFFDSTNYRRFYQLVAYAEKELGDKWPDLLDKLAGGGVALGVQSEGFTVNDAPALLVVRGKDAKLMQKAFALGVTVLEQELARQDKPAATKRTKYHNVEIVELGPQTFLALAGPSLLVANREAVLKQAIDLHAGKAKKSMADHEGLLASRKLLPPKPLASVWIDWEPVRKSPAAADIYKTPRDPALTVLFGGYVDLLSRTPYVTMGLHQDKDGFLATVRMPVGRDGMGASDGALHLAAKGQPGVRPLLEPKGVMYSDSFHLDVTRIWEDREKLFGEEAAKNMAEFDKQSGMFLSGLQMSKLLKAVGPYHRVVAVHQPTTPYKRQPQQAIPAFAVISELRQPEEFAQGMNTALRGAALAATTQVKLKLTEETYKDVDIVGYRFDEEAELKQDTTDARFAFSPCFCRVGNQYVWCSTIELCRELVDLLQAEQKAPPKLVDAAKTRTRLYGAGGAELAAAFQDVLTAQAVLDQAVKPEEAKRQTDALLALLRKSGVVELSASFTDKEFHYDIRTKAK